jgi:ATP synthase protein I
MFINLGGGSTEETRMLWRLAGMGFQFGTEIIAGVLLGWFVDRMWGTAPWGVVIGAIAGILVAMMHLLRQAMRLNREMDRTDAGRKRAKTQAAAPIPEAGERDRIRELMESEIPDEELTHEEWKALRDRDDDPNPSDADEHER